LALPSRRCHDGSTNWNDAVNQIVIDTAAARELQGAINMPNTPSLPNKRAEIDAFLERVPSSKPPANSPGARGRMIFALDATMSRQPTWDQACVLQAEMFREAASIGGLNIQLVYYRGLAECHASPWIAEPQRLGELMSRIHCRCGHTQIAKIIARARRENDNARIGALVFVGDAMEEIPADVYGAARELRMPAFLFQEGNDPSATKTFDEVARLTRGAHVRFDQGSANQLGELLRAVAAYAAGGLAALNRSTSGAAVKLLMHLKK
jgi:hypothetical protein